MPGRVRIRIEGGGTGKQGYFSLVSETLVKAFPGAEVRVRPLTGSILVQGPDIDLSALSGLALENGIFLLENPAGPVTVARIARRQVKKVDAGIRKWTAGGLDMAGSVFVILILHAMREIIRGNLVMPSWFTALWFATTIYNRDFFRPGEGGGEDHGDTPAAE
jgi:hypothetical protein